MTRLQICRACLKSFKVSGTSPVACPACNQRANWAYLVVRDQWDARPWVITNAGYAILRTQGIDPEVTDPEIKAVV